MSSKAKRIQKESTTNEAVREYINKDMEMNTSTIGSLLSIVMMNEPFTEVYKKFKELQADPSEFEQCDTIKKLADFYIEKYYTDKKVKKQLKNSLAFIYDDGWREVRDETDISKTKKVQTKNHKTPIFVLTTKVHHPYLSHSLPLYDCDVIVGTAPYGIVYDAIKGNLWAKLEYVYK